MRYLHGQHGQAMIELALVLPFLLLIVLGIANFGTAFDRNNQEIAASRTAARYAAGNACDPCAPGQPLNAWILSTLSGALQAHASVEITFPGAAPFNHCTGKPVKARIVWHDYPLIPMLAANFGITRITALAGSTTMRLERNWNGDPATGAGSPSDKFDALPGSATMDACP